jgi:hypothetical protein
MNGKAHELANRLLELADNLKYGTISISLKIHGGIITAIETTRAENTREQGLCIEGGGK